MRGLDGIEVRESPYLEAGTWGYLMWNHPMGGIIVTPSARRLAANVHQLGIRRGGKIELMPGKVAVEPDDPPTR